MIEIEAVFDSDGVLRACKASGHAGVGKIGNDIVCSAVTVLIRTAFNVLTDKSGITIRGGAPERGQVWLEADYETEGRDFLFAVGVFLKDGLKSVADEYPDNCRFDITERRN